MIKMKFEKLNQEDKELIKDAMKESSVNTISQSLQCKKVMSEETFDKEMNRGKRLVYLLNVLDDKKEYKENSYINIGITFVLKDGKEIELTEKMPSYFSDSDINERLWDKYSDKYDIDEILWDEL
jgi:hypothetical protein